jgi:hypothetical protein
MRISVSGLHVQRECVQRLQCRYRSPSVTAVTRVSVYSVVTWSPPPPHGRFDILLCAARVAVLYNRVDQSSYL